MNGKHPHDDSSNHDQNHSHGTGHEHSFGDGDKHAHAHGHLHADEPRSQKHSHTHTQNKAVLNRLSRAIGHLNAVRGMVEEGRDCPEVLIQLSAVRSAINGVCEVILKDHIDHCIVDAVNTGDMAAVEELNRAIALLMK